MRNTRNYVGMVLTLMTLSACGTTGRFVEQPQLTIDDSHRDARQAVGELFSLATPYTVKLCEADTSSKACKQDDKGISASGVGGLFLPLRLYVKGINVHQQSQSIDGVALEASLDAKVDAIPPLCGTVRGRIVSRDNNTVSVQFKNFYCNWVAVGNVIVNADFSIDNINLKDRVFTGFYKVTFHGTGNAGGSGYYKAVITPGRAQVRLESPEPFAAGSPRMDMR